MQISGWSRGVIVAVAGILGLLIALGISLEVPRQYASTAVIKIAPSNFVSGEPGTSKSVGNYVNHLIYGVMSQASLMSIIEGSDLYRSEPAKTAPEGVIDNMRRRITVRPKSSKSDGRMAFSIQFVHTDPVIAQRVTQQLAARIMDESLRESLSGKESMTLEITDAPSLPGTPVSPNWWKISVVGLMAGMLIGMIAAVFRRPLKLV